MSETIAERVKSLNWRQWLLLVAFLFVVGFTGLHAFRFVRSTVYWHRHRDETIRGWMTIGYVAHSYHVPPYILYEALGLPNKPPDRRPLREIAKAQNRSIEETRAVLQDAIVHARPPYPPPPPLPPDKGRSP
jgi:hypothetical protein